MTKHGGVCRNCGGIDRAGPDGLCDPCRALAQDLAAVKETVRRLQAWAHHEGSRQGLAAWLTRECLAAEPHAPAPVRWVLVWEMSGAQKELRKLVERLLPYWTRRGIAVTEPPALQPVKVEEGED